MVAAGRILQEGGGSFSWGRYWAWMDEFLVSFWPLLLLVHFESFVQHSAFFPFFFFVL